MQSKALTVARAPRPSMSYHWTLCSLRTLGRSLTVVFLLMIFSISAHAIVVRGTVTDPLGAAVVGAQIRLIQGAKVAAVTVSGPDGSYEIRSAAPGRFLLLTSARTFTPNISKDFYGGRTDVVTRDIVMEVATVTEQMTVIATGISTPIQQISSAVTLIPLSALATQIGITNDLRQSPGNDVVQTGQAGGVTSLFVRGGNSDANKVLIDGIPANDVGGVFDFGTVSSTGLDGLELYRGANSALYGSNAVASVVNLSTPRGDSPRPVLNYSGSAGNFHTYDNEGVLSGAWNRLDYYGAFNRFDTSNSIPLDEYHSATSVANLGYNITTNTQARFTLRNAVSATGLPEAREFYGISASGKQGDQDLYSGFTVENQFHGNWHNLVRYGIARKREQVTAFEPVGEPITSEFDGVSYTTYYGSPVTINGANGYSATGQAAFFFPDEDAVSNSDELYYQTDYTFPHRITALFGFRYENERGSFVDPDAFENEKIKRTNYQYTFQVQGDIKYRFFYSLGGAVENNQLYGIAGTPRVGVAYYPVRPGPRLFHGTKLRASFATGVQEPSLAAEYSSLYTELVQSGNQAAIAAYNVTPIGAERSRTYDVGVDQNIIGQKLIVKGGYFHNEFSHQIEVVDSSGLKRYFGIPPSIADQLYGAALNSLAFRAQGGELEVQYQPFTHLFLRGGYTYLATIVLQSFASDAIAANDGTPTTNPNIPGVAIGALSPLVGARTFRRPPQSGFFDVQYTTGKLSAALKGAMASRSDDSTYQLDNDINGGNTLLLPNLNLDHGFAKLDLNGMFAASRHVTIFTQLDNLLSQQHIGPIGYPSLPFTVRAGLKIRLGGN
jgi:vitamin B12 transporter